MKRRLLFCVNVVLVSGAAAALVNCSGGERPKAEESLNRTDAGSIVTSGEITIAPLVDGKVLFGEEGYVNCGTAGGDQFLTLTNPTDRVVNFTTAVTQGKDLFTINPPGGGIPARSAARIQITPKAIPSESDIALNLYSGRLEISLDPSKPPVSIPLVQHPRGAIITTTLAAEVNLGDVKVGTPKTQQFSVRNDGNLEVTGTFSLANGTQFKLDNQTSASVKLVPNAQESHAISLLTAEPTDYVDTVGVRWSSGAAFCKEPLTGATLRGRGTSSVGVTPGTLAFGQVDCGTAGQPLNVTIESTIAMTFEPTFTNLGAGYYTLADANDAPINPGATVPVAAASTFILKVIPKPIPFPGNMTPDFYKDELKIKTNVPNDTEHKVILSQSARGAVLAFGEPAITHTGPLNESKNNQVRVVNTGNASAGYAVSLIPRSGYPAPQVENFNLIFPNGTVSAGTPATGTLVTKTASSPNTTYGAALQLGSTSGVLCADLPAPIPVTVSTAAGNSVTLSVTQLDFGEVDCGKKYEPNGGYQTVTITSAVDTTFIPSLGDNSPYTLQNNTGGSVTLGVSQQLFAGQPFVLRVLPKAIPSRPVSGVAVGTWPNGFNDTLTITTPVDPPKTVALTQTPRGAMFRITPGLLTYNGPGGTQPFTLVNDGNLEGQYTLSFGGGYATVLAPTSGTLPKGQIEKQISITGSGNGSQVTMTSTTVLCLDLPVMTVDSTITP